MHPAQRLYYCENRGSNTVASWQIHYLSPYLRTKDRLLAWLAGQWVTSYEPWSLLRGIQTSDQDWFPSKAGLVSLFSNCHSTMAESSNKRVFQKLTANEQNQLPSVRSKLCHSPKPKLIKDRILKLEEIKPVRWLEQWSQCQKIWVFVFFYDYCISIYVVGQCEYQNCGEYRSPTPFEALQLFQIQQRTISHWVWKQEEIERYSSWIIQMPHEVIICQWPELECRPYYGFLDRQEQGQAIWTRWFQVH